MDVHCSSDWKRVHIYKSKSEIPAAIPKRGYMGNGNIMIQTRKKRSIDTKIRETVVLNSSYNPCSQLHLPITVEIADDGTAYYNTSVRFK